MTKHYTWADNARFNVDPQVVGEELERIRSRDGGVTVNAMLQEAKPEDAPLHPLCTWDDAVAGEKWRKHELRQVPRSLRVITQEQQQPAFVHIKPEPSRSAPGYYQSASVAVANLDEYELAFKACCQRIASAQQGLADLERLAKGNGTKRDRERRALIQQVEQALAIASKALEQAR